MELAINENRQICRFSRHFRQKKGKRKRAKLTDGVSLSRVMFAFSSWLQLPGQRR